MFKCIIKNYNSKKCLNSEFKIKIYYLITKILGLHGDILNLPLLFIMFLVNIQSVNNIFIYAKKMLPPK